MAPVRLAMLETLLCAALAAACTSGASPTSVPTPTGLLLVASSGASRPLLPATVEGLTVLSVPGAIGAYGTGAFPDDSLVAVGGWLEPLVPLSCPFDPANPNPALLERACGWQDHVLAEQPQALATVIDNGNGSGSVYGRDPAGRYLSPRQGPGAPVNVAVHDHPRVAGSGYDPRAAIIVGHFHDPRASLCPASQRSTCDSEFVADQVAWLDGETIGPTFWIGGDARGAGLVTRLDEQGVEAAARTAIAAGSTVIWMSGLPAGDIAIVDPRPSLRVAPETPVWFVRYTTPTSASTLPTGGSGWLVLDDATGSVLARPGGDRQPGASAGP